MDDDQIIYQRSIDEWQIHLRYLTKTLDRLAEEQKIHTSKLISIEKCLENRRNIFFWVSRNGIAIIAAIVTCSFWLFKHLDKL